MIDLLSLTQMKTKNKSSAMQTNRDAVEVRNTLSPSQSLSAVHLQAMTYSSRPSRNNISKPKTSQSTQASHIHQAKRRSIKHAGAQADGSHRENVVDAQTGASIPCTGIKRTDVMAGGRRFQSINHISVQTVPDVIVATTLQLS